MIGFGLDLGGFRKETKTVLAGIQRNGDKAEVMLLCNSPFSEKLNGDFSARLDRERAALEKMISQGSVAIDVPIDLQGLPNVDASEAWHLTLRPVDKAMKGLAPLASYLGACVARFQAINTASFRALLGVRLFEAYPAACLREIFGKAQCVEDYKKEKPKHREAAKRARLSLCEKLKFIDVNQILGHDEIDAILCAMTAVPTKEELLDFNDYQLPIDARLPDGYRVLKKNPFSEIRVTMKSFAEIVKACQ